jgi:hypothetical protein
MLAFRATAFVQKTRHDAVSADRAAVGGTVSSRWPVTVPLRRFALGALLAGMAADLPGLAAAIWLAAGLAGMAGLILAARRYQAQRRGRTGRRCRAAPQP